MRRALLLRVPALGAVCALGTLGALGATARADDAAVERIWAETSGEIRAGWRFVHDPGEGRFFQDRSLTGGARIFDADVHGETDREDAALTSWEATAHGIGDEEQDARLRLGKADAWSLEGGWARDDYSYRATGDPFPYDTVRQRYDLRARWTPSSRLTVRLDWDRYVRRGDAYVGQDTDIRELPAPPGVDDDIVQSHRPLRQESDRVTLGADAAFDGGLRLSLAQSVRLAQVDDTRVYDVPPENRTSIPVREALDREVRSPAWTTTAKAGWTPPGSNFDVSAIFSYTVQTVDSRVNGSSTGYDGRFDSMGSAPRGQFTEITGGGNDLDRDFMHGRVEGTWRPHPDWEVTVGLERETTVDDASLNLDYNRSFVRTDVPSERTHESYDARVTDRLDRASVEGAWQASETVRLRLGEERLRESLKVPTDTPTDSFEPTSFTSHSWRTTAGVDWEATKRLDLSLLLRHSSDDEPHTATSSDTGDEVSYRGRWKASDELSLTTVYRLKDYRHDAEYDSSAASQSASVGAAWTHDKLTIAPNVTWQTVDTRTDTSFFEMTGGSFQQIRDQVSFKTRDLIASVDVRYEFAKSLRGFFTGTWIRSGGDYGATWHDLAVGAEHDLTKTVSVGAAVRSWRLDEQGTNVDDYTTLGGEIWVTIRF